MGINLSGPGGSYFFNFFAWPAMLRLAVMYGWEPQGTIYNEAFAFTGAAEQWDGRYDVNEGQIITERDAANLADALERSLDDIPDGDVMQHKCNPDGTFPVVLRTSQQSPLVLSPLGMLINPFEYFSGPEGKADLKSFIEYCRAGPMSIM